MNRFFLLVAALILSGWIVSASSVQAAGCIEGPVNGICRTGALGPGQTTLCGADEINASGLISNYGDIFSNGASCAGDCCVTKGQILCGSVASAAGATSPYTCQKPCLGKKLLGGLGEMCGADQECCDTRTGTTASSTGSTKGSSGSPITLTNPLGAGTTIFTVINRAISFFLGMVGALALGVFVYAGILWMTAGSSDRVKTAQAAMKYAVIGLAMIAFSYAITSFFLNAFLNGAATPGATTTIEAQEPIPLGE